MSNDSDNPDLPPRDRAGVIGGVAELAAHIFGAVARIFVR